MYSMIESLLSVNAGALNTQGGWHHIGRRGKEQRAKGQSAKGEGQEEIFHFPFSICHFLFGEELRA